MLHRGFPEWQVEAPWKSAPLRLEQGELGTEWVEWEL